jgi:phage tail sheath protein FI
VGADDMSSPFVRVNILDQSQPIQSPASGIPAGVVGTAAGGPAFVPVTFTNYASWQTLFGESGDRFGPIAVSQWLANASQATYVRVLGTGDGSKRNASTGQVNNAGFVVGGQEVLNTGLLGNNPYANVGGVEGRTHFLGCYMSESAGSTVFSEAGIQTGPAAVSILRGIVMTPSGVALTLSGVNIASNAPASLSSAPNGGTTGSIDVASGQFTLLLNGHISTSRYPNIITASFAGDSHIKNVLNRDPTLIQQAGHYLYTFYDVPSSLAVITGTNVLKTTDALAKIDAVFVATSSISRNTSTTVIPNYENFRERYQTPHTPYIVSQDFGGSRYPLFKVVTLSDGAVPNVNDSYRIRIENIRPSNNDAYEYGTFDLSVIKYFTTGSELVKQFSGLSLDPTSQNYIARQIGDQNVYFDFDRASSSQKLVVSGDYPTTTPYVRVELSSDLVAGNVPATALPFGFRGYGVPVTSGSILAYPSDSGAVNAGQLDIIRRVVVPPVPMRKNISTGTPAVAQDTLPWGTQFTLQSLTDGYNYSEVYDDSVASYASFFPSFKPGGANFFNENSTSADSFANNLFTIEKIKVVTGSDTYADPEQWNSATYVRQGGITADSAAKTRALTAGDLGNTTSNTNTYVWFDVMMQGGFNGTNIFDAEKTKLTNLAAKREVDDINQGGATSGPTVVAYKKAIDIMGSSADTDIQVLATPGIRIPSITNYAISAVENRFDAMYVMDIEERDNLNNVITGSTTPEVTSTVNAFTSRNLNSSFVAAYFPDIFMNHPDTGIPTKVPPSIAALSAFSSNDRIGSYWNAPAGYNRAALTNVTNSSIEFKQRDLDVLYDVAINPIVFFPGSGFTVWGQKTLLKAASSLDRINVRRLLIFLRRQVRAVANSLLFEPNTQATLDRFNALVNPILQRVQAGGGVDRYRVQIDTSTTTQADIENNTIRGKIFVQPTRTAEFITIDFVVNGRSTS